MTYSVYFSFFRSFLQTEPCSSIVIFVVEWPNTALKIFSLVLHAYEQTDTHTPMPRSIAHCIWYKRVYHRRCGLSSRCPCVDWYDFVSVGVECSLHCFVLFSLCFVVCVRVCVRVSPTYCRDCHSSKFVWLDLNGVCSTKYQRSLAYTHTHKHKHTQQQQYSHNNFSVVQINWKPLNQFIYSVRNERLFSAATKDRDFFYLFI